MEGRKDGGRSVALSCSDGPLLSGLVGHHRFGKALVGDSLPAVGVPLCQGPVVHGFPIEVITFVLTFGVITELPSHQTGHTHHLGLI